MIPCRIGSTRSVCSRSVCRMLRAVQGTRSRLNNFQPALHWCAAGSGHARSLHTQVQPQGRGQWSGSTPLPHPSRTNHIKSCRRSPCCQNSCSDVHVALVLRVMRVCVLASVLLALSLSVSPSVIPSTSLPASGSSWSLPSPVFAADHRNRIQQGTNGSF